MRLIPEPLAIGKSDDFKKAVIDRTAYGEFLTNLVRNTKEPLVIAIDGRWGEGKTTFVKIWQNQLECRGVWEKYSAKHKTPALYIDAFKMEATDDIFISLVAEIDSFVSERCGNLSRLNSLKEVAIKLGTRMLPVAAKVAIRAATLNTLTHTDFNEIKVDPESISGFLSEQTEKLLAERLQSIAGQKKVIDEFRSKLSELPGSITENPSKQLVIIIDELDRCSPKYAVEFLEKIKHFFSTENVKFVLVINKMQLESSIRSFYGNGINASEYIQKFVDLELKLNRDRGKPQFDASLYCKELEKAHGIPSDELSRNFVDLLSGLANHSDISLRQIEKSFVNFVLFRMTCEKFIDKLRKKFITYHNNTFPSIAHACIAKSIDPEHFRALSKTQASSNEIPIIYEKWTVNDIHDSDLNRLIECIVLFGIGEDDFASAPETSMKGSIKVTCSDASRLELYPMIYDAIAGFPT